MASPDAQRIAAGMRVCDITGGKIGSVSGIHRIHEPPQLPDHLTIAGMAEEILEVKTGLFGLGKHLYIPTSAIQEVVEDRIFVSHPKSDRQ